MLLRADAAGGVTSILEAPAGLDFTKPRRIPWSNSRESVPRTLTAIFGDTRFPIGQKKLHENGVNVATLRLCDLLIHQDVKIDVLLELTKRGCLALTLLDQSLEVVRGNAWSDR